MHHTIETVPTLESRFQSTRHPHRAEGVPVSRPNDDGRMALAFFAGIVLTAVAFVAGVPFLTQH